MPETEIAGIIVPAVVTDDLVAKSVVDLLNEKYQAGKGSLSLADVRKVLNYGLDRPLALRRDKEQEVLSHIEQQDPTEVYKIWKNRVSDIALQVDFLNTKFEKKEEKKWRPLSKIQRLFHKRRGVLKAKSQTALSEVIKLLGEGCPKEILVDNLRDPVIKETDVPSIAEYPTLQKAFQDIQDLLQRDEVKCVALLGQQGVGKTTIMQHLNNYFYDIPDNKEFDMVIFIKVATDEQTDLRTLRQIAERIRVDREGHESEVAGRIQKVLENKRYLLILDGVRNPISGIWEKLDISKDKKDSKVTTYDDHTLSGSGCVDKRVMLGRLSRTEAWKMFRHSVGDNHLPPTAKTASLLEEEISSKSSTNAISKPHLLQDVLGLMRMQDFLHLMLSYPMRIGYEAFLERWIHDVHRLLSFADDDDVADTESLRRKVEHLISESPLRYVHALIPEDITKGIMNGGGVSTETALKRVLKRVPQHILVLATRLALHQLTLTLTSDDNIQNIWFSTRTNADKQTVVENIQANSQIRAAFDDLQIIDLNQIDDEIKRELELLNLETRLEKTTNDRRSRHLVLVVDGDGDKKLDPVRVSLPINDSENVMVFITTLSSNDYLISKVDLTIKTEDHLLPWEVFCSNVGSGLVHSSIAVQIVEKCGGHLLAVILVAKSLKNMTDEKIWETALEKLRYRDRAAIVNAFFNITWANVISEREKIRLIKCIMVCKFQDWKESDDQLFAHWFSEQLVDTEKKAKSILRDFMECSVLLQFEDSLGLHSIHLPEDIKIILHALGEEVPENLREGALASTISNLQVLNLTITHMQNLYDVNTQPHLKELNLEGCMLETLPEAIFRIQKLETLSLEHCSQLLELPPQIAKLENLKELRLEGCTRLEELPQEIWELVNLQTISLAGTSSFPSSENQELINSDDFPLSSSKYHEHSGRDKKAIPSSSSAIIPIGFTLKLKAHRQFTPFEKFCQYIMQLQIQNVEKCDLSGTHITDLPPSLNFPKLRNLLLGNNLDLTKIPSSFFDYVPQLSILDLSRSSIHELPSSIFNLQGLRQLYLKDCELFVELPPEISQLKNLTTLDLDGTLITHLPEEIQELKKLENLSLSFCNDNIHDDSRFNVIPYSVLTQFTYLKVLRIDVNSDNEWWLKNFERVLEQVSAFKKLLVLDVYIPSINFQAPIKESLFNFRFIIGHHRPSDSSLKFVNGDEYLPDNVKTILSEAWAFFLDRHMTIKNLTHFGLENLKQLRFCILAECNEMQSIVEVDEKSFCMQFLTIFYMKNLRSIINRPILGRPVFSELKLLALYACPELSTIFTVDFLHSLVNLEELVVEDCPKVRSIISCSSSEPTTDFFLPRLRKLSLLFVPELSSISNRVRIARNLEQMGLYYCPNLQSLSTSELSSEKLKVIRAEMEWWGKLQWSKVEWGQEGPPHKFSEIFSPFDEDLDILTQLTPYELMTSFNTENDSE